MRFSFVAFIIYHRRFIENEMRRKLDKTEINDIVGERQSEKNIIIKFISNRSNESDAN